MAKKKSKKKEEKEDEEISWLSEEARGSIWAVVLLVIAFLSLLGLVDLAGSVGAILKEGLIMSLGWGAWLFPVLLLLVVYLVIIAKQMHRRLYHIWGLGCVLIGIVGLFHLIIPLEEAWPAISLGSGGGYLGFAITFPLRQFTGTVASVVILAAIVLVGFILLLNTPLSLLLRPWRLWTLIKGWWAAQFKKDESIEEADEAFDEEEKEAPAPARRVRQIAEAVVSNTEKEPAPKVKLPKIDIPIDLLDKSAIQPQSGNIKQNSEQIKKTLETFGIDVEMGDVNIGPTVTQYTLKPSDGVKLAQITALSNDLALALKALSIRIEAPIPGKALVGIEIPNKTIAVVPLRNILESSTFRKRKSPLTLALGQDVAGNSFTANLPKMPHLLIAGATGSGKSVCINTCLVSMLYQNSPSDLRFILVDPKRVELSMYNGIPHLLTPVITDVQKTINALKWTVSEMELRYEKLAEAGKRNIESYNQSVSSEDQIPYIVFVIDELADIMAVAAREVEAMVIRLAQMARAVGIHLMLATQRPSVNVITGLIKANITTRVAFSVASAVDSRTIIDSSGAEKLLGRGDMLYISSELSKPRRAQGAFLSEEEVKRVVDFLKQKAEPDYVDAVTEKHGTVSAGGVVSAPGADYDDDLYEEARDLIVESGKASASFLQRRLRVGYARAARLLDILEENGLVGPAEGSKPREVLVEKNETEGYDVQEQDKDFDNSEYEEAEGERIE